MPDSALHPRRLALLLVVGLAAGLVGWASSIDGLHLARQRGEAPPPPAADPPAADPPAADPPAAALEAFAPFWTRFRAAALAGDTAAVLAMTRLPFRTRGPMDDDPVRTHARTAFPHLFFGRLLALDHGLRREPETMRALLARTATAPARDVDADAGRARVGAFVFERTARDGVWRLVMAYVDDDS